MKCFLTFAAALGAILLRSVLFCLPGSAQGLPRHAPAATMPTLIFQSGFEGTSRVVAGPRPADHPSAGPNDDIIGIDTSLDQKSDWVRDLDHGPEAGTFRLEYTGGDSTRRTARIIPEPGRLGNKVLAFRIYDSWPATENQVKARVQADIYGIRGGYREFYQSVRVFLPISFAALREYPDKINWLTISEFWNNEWWVPTEHNGFRVTLGIGKPGKGIQDLSFILNAEDKGQREVWNANQHAVQVPIGQWFTMEYYFREGNAETGRFYMAITPAGGSRQVVFDVKNYTHNTADPHPNGVTAYNPMKLYTSKDVVAFMKARGLPLEIYWDDFKLWKNKRPQ